MKKTKNRNRAFLTEDFFGAPKPARKTRNWLDPKHPDRFRPRFGSFRSTWCCYGHAHQKRVKWPKIDYFLLSPLCSSSSARLRRGLVTRPCGGVSHARTRGTRRPPRCRGGRPVSPYPIGRAASPAKSCVHAGTQHLFRPGGGGTSRFVFGPSDSETRAVTSKAEPRDPPNAECKGINWTCIGGYNHLAFTTNMRAVVFVSSRDERPRHRLLQVCHWLWRCAGGASPSALPPSSANPPLGGAGGFAGRPWSASSRRSSSYRCAEVGGGFS